MYTKDTEVTFTVTGKATGEGYITIGCRTFSEEQVAEVAQNLSIKAPPTPNWRDGDVVEVHYWNRDDWVINVRKDGLWQDKNGNHATRGDEWVEGWLRESRGARVKVHVRGGVPQ